MTEKEKLLKDLVPQETEEVTVLEDNYTVPSLKDEDASPLTDLEMLVVGDYVSSVSREEIMSKYGLTKPKLNKILRKPKAKSLAAELEEEKRNNIKARLGGSLYEITEDYLEFIEAERKEGKDIRKILFYAFGTSSLMDVYEKLGKMDKNEGGEGSPTFQSLFNEIKIGQ